MATVGWFLYFSVVCALFSVVVLIGSSTNNKVIEELCWMKATFGDSCRSDTGCGNVFIGVYNLVQTFESSDSKTSTNDLQYASDSECPDNIDLCGGCDSAMKLVIAMTVLVLLLSIAQVILNTARLTEKGNTFRNKCLGIGCSFLSFLCLVGAMGMFGMKCAYRVIEYYADFGVSYTTWTIGPSLLLYVLMVLLKLFDAFGQMCTPVTKSPAPFTPINVPEVNHSTKAPLPENKKNVEIDNNKIMTESQEYDCL